MSAEFNKLIDYIEKMQKRYFRAVSALNVYESLEEVLAPNIVGQDTAEDNAEVFKKFNEFMSIAKESARVYFFIELAKLFDISDESLHITKIVNYTQSNISKLMVDDFSEYSQDREFITSLIENYKGVNHSDLVKIKIEIEKNEELISRLKDYRDQYLAHDDINKKDIEINREEVKKLFDLIEKVLNIFSSKLISTISVYDHIERDTKSKIKTLFDHLKKYEPHRLKEIEEDCKKELEKINIIDMNN